MKAGALVARNIRMLRLARGLSQEMLAVDAGDRPHLCQPSRTRTGESERRGSGKTRARAVFEHRGIFHGAARLRGRRPAASGANMKGKGRGLPPKVTRRSAG